MLKELHEIAARWEVESVLRALSEAESSSGITVGLLGDFSSGKTTLINELVGVPDLLPTRLEPCTATAGLIISVEGISEVAAHRLLPDGTLSPVSQAELDDLSRGLIPGRPVVHVPSTPALPAGVGLADTPGLGSLTKGHFDTTFAELPYLDAAIICVDAQKGGLTRSITDFLRSPGVRHLRHRFMLALTHADLKSAADLAAIKARAVQGLAEAIEASATDVQDRVVTVAAGAQAHARGRADVSEVVDAIQRLVVARRATIAEERRQRAAERLVPDLKRALEQRLQAVRATDSDAAKSVEALSRAAAELHAKRDAHAHRLEEFQARLRAGIVAACRGAVGAFAAASTDEAIAEAGAALAARISSTIDSSVAEHRDVMEGFVTPDLDGVVQHVRAVNRYADVGKTVATAALAAAILPSPVGGGLAAANSVQAGAGAVLGGVGRRFAGGLLKGLHDINPAQLVGDVIAQRVKQSSLLEHLDVLAADVAAAATQRLESSFEDQYFQPIQAQLTEHAAQLRAAEAGRRAELDQKRKLLRDIEDDISSLVALTIR
jgi:hypothetical protein